ncbi:MAG: HTTM domain-containing protein [Mycobacteriales bacterium]
MAAVIPRATASTHSSATSWLFVPQARGRIAWLRLAAYVFVPLDIFYATPWVAQHADVPGRLYHALTIARVLHLPEPTPTSIRATMWLLLVTSIAAVAGRAPRLLGAAVAVLYAWWMLIAMSYGKVDHDRYAFLVLLAVLPTVGPVRRDDTREDAESGWALWCVQLAVVATYFLAAVAKFRFGGWNWATGSTLSFAILRRGTFLADPLLQLPWLIVALQWGILMFELATPMLLVRNRWRSRFVLFLYGFHLSSCLGLRIAFWPHLVALLAFVPLEHLPKWWAARRRSTEILGVPRPRSAATVAVSVDEAR